MNVTHLKPLTTAILIASASALPQIASASSFYNGSVDFTYTITATNRNTAGDLLALSISDAFTHDTAGASASSTSAADHQPFSGLGTAHTVSFQAQDSVQLGFAASNYYSNLKLSFENQSLDTNDIFDVNIAFNYSLSAQSGGNGDVDATFSYSNEDYSFTNSAIAHASVAENFAQHLSSDTFNFVLSAGQIENLYFDSALSGQLEATVVPVPAAIWLFGAGLAGLLGCQRRTAVKIPAA